MFDIKNANEGDWVLFSNGKRARVSVKRDSVKYNANFFFEGLLDGYTAISPCLLINPIGRDELTAVGIYPSKPKRKDIVASIKRGSTIYHRDGSSQIVTKVIRRPDMIEVFTGAPKSLLFVSNGRYIAGEKNDLDIVAVKN